MVDYSHLVQPEQASRVYVHSSNVRALAAERGSIATNQSQMQAALPRRDSESGVSSCTANRAQVSVPPCHVPNNGLCRSRAHLAMVGSAKAHAILLAPCWRFG
jgi:hypothetical protein